tara:strand:+ start:348 stop:776 length:429 start_codon:yes stop_codon:yes gene_type:complete
MAGLTVATLGAGSKLYYEPVALPGTWVLLAGALNIGEVGEQGEFIETTPILAEVREYTRGLKTPPNKTMTFNDTPGDADYVAFLAEVDADASVQFKVEYKNNHQAVFTLILSGRLMQEAEGGAQLKMNIFGQQSGATAWSVI